MTAQWKRRAQRAEERRALEEATLRIARRTQESVAETLAAYDLKSGNAGPPLGALTGAVHGEVVARESKVLIGELATFDPRGRVTVICGRCGQPALSETTPTILAHYTEAHGKAPRQLVLGRFEERCEVME